MVVAAPEVETAPPAVPVAAPPPAPAPAQAPHGAPMGWGSPADYQSRWWEHMRDCCGVSAHILAAYDVRLCARPDERHPHPAQSPRLYYRYPIWEEDGLPLTWRLAAVDGEHPRSAWEGAPHPEMIYEPLGIIAGAPLVVAGDVLGVWVLASMGIAACTFLCGASADVPGRALAQIVAGGPSSVLVVDNERASLPRGALAIARALRSAGVPAGYARVRARGALAIGRPDGATMVDLAQCERWNAEGLWRALGALARERAS